MSESETELGQRQVFSVKELRFWGYSRTNEKFLQKAFSSVQALHAVSVPEIQLEVFQVAKALKATGAFKDIEVELINSHESPFEVAIDVRVLEPELPVGFQTGVEFSRSEAIMVR